MPIPILDLSRSFLNGNTRRVYMRRWCLRTFAEFLGSSRKEYLGALERFLCLTERQANGTFRAFRPWLEERGFAPSVIKACAYAVRPFLAYARTKGAVKWSIKDKRDEARARAWSRLPPRIQQLGQEWLESLENRNLSKPSLKNAKSSLLDWGKSLAEQEIGGLRLEPEHVKQWLATLRSRGISVNTVRTHFHLVRCFYNWLAARGIVKHNIFWDVPAPRKIRPIPQYLDEKEIERLILSAQKPRDRALLEVLYASGCRIHEASSINVGDVSFKKRTARCMGKGGRERLLILNKSALGAIQAYLPERENTLGRAGRSAEIALFVNCRGGRYVPGGLSHLVRRIAIKAGLQGRARAHVIRHSFATHLLNRGADFASIQRLLGHKHIESTAIYAHLVHRRIQHVYRKARPRK